MPVTVLTCKAIGVINKINTFVTGRQIFQRHKIRGCVKFWTFFFKTDKIPTYLTKIS